MEPFLTWFNSSSFATANRICLGVTRPFLLSRAAFPANSRISAAREDKTFLIKKTKNSKTTLWIVFDEYSYKVVYG